MDAKSLSSIARIATEVPRRYLGQLCKHFEHRPTVSVSLAEEHGRIEFPFGVCTLDAEALIMRVTATDEAALAKLEDVAARHLERFAFRDKPEIVWTRESPAGA